MEQTQRGEDAGTYTCQASNRQRHAARRDVEVQILGPYIDRYTITKSSRSRKLGFVESVWKIFANQARIQKVPVNETEINKVYDFIFVIWIIVLLCIHTYYCFAGILTYF